MMQNENPRIFSYGYHFYFFIFEILKKDFEFCVVFCVPVHRLSRLDVELRRRKNSAISGILHHTKYKAVNHKS